MFSVGIFTTHLPYIAMFAFYAYFLLTGVSQANEGKIKVTENSPTVQIHIDNSVENFSSESCCYYTSFKEFSDSRLIERNPAKLNWMHFGFFKIEPQDFLEKTLFGRPPPVLA